MQKFVGELRKVLPSEPRHLAPDHSAQSRGKPDSLGRQLHLLLHLDEVSHPEPAERAALTGTEISETGKASGRIEQLLHLLDGDLVVVNLDRDVECPGRELWPHDGDRRPVCCQHAATLVGNPLHLRLVEERDEPVALVVDEVRHNRKECRYQRGFACGHLGLLVEDYVPTSIHECSKQIVGWEAELFIWSETQLFLSHVFY